MLEGLEIKLTKFVKSKKKNKSKHTSTHGSLQNDWANGVHYEDNFNSL